MFFLMAKIKRGGGSSESCKMITETQWLCGQYGKNDHRTIQRGKEVAIKINKCLI